MNNIKIKSKNLNVYYGNKQALFDVNLDLNEKEVTALIGPSGCGKSTFIRCINRMNDVIDICKVTGNIEMDGMNINDKDLDVVSLRERVGMVFQKPNPFPKSIYDNISYGPKIHGKGETKSELDQIVENSLKKSALWEEVKDRLDEPGTSLSGGRTVTFPMHPWQSIDHSVIPLRRRLHHCPLRALPGVILVALDGQ